MLKNIFDKAQQENRKVFIPYFPAGYPTLAKSKKAFLQLTQSGSDIIEVGIPFSDPLADGPTIQAASTTALAAGLKIDGVFDLLSSAKNNLAPTVIMTYYNLLYSNGLKNFARKAAKAGVKGVIIPDLPLDEADEWINASKDHLETIFFAAPTSSNERIKKTSDATTAFIYCVSLTGVTGARKDLPADLGTFLKRVQKITDKPIAVGFGVSTKQHVKQLSPLADGIIVGSAIIKAYDNASTERESLNNIDKLISSLFLPPLQKGD